MPAPSAIAINRGARLRLGIILLGWLGLGLFAANELVDDWQFETVSHDLLRTFDIIKNCLFALWPVSVWLQIEPRLTGTRQNAANLGLCLIIFPWWVYCGLLIMMEDQAPWQDELVLYTSVEPPMHIVRQYKDVFVTTSTSYRVVKITPLGPCWQKVEPADSSKYPLN